MKFGLICFAGLFAALSARLSWITIVEPAEPRRAVLARPVPPSEHLPNRASITDRNGVLLAVSLPVMAVYANPREVQDPAGTADRLRTVLPYLDRERLIERLRGERHFAYIARSVTPREVQAVNNLGLIGVYFESAERRQFPQGRAAVHVIGNADIDGVGISGVEGRFNERLLARRGAPLRLSIDVRVQLAMRDALQHAISDFNGIGGAGVLMDANTSEVLAMVSLPDYDANGIGDATPDERFNRVTVGVYEPGSTFKLFTAAMALEYGTVQPWSGYDASRPIRYGRFTINDFRGKNRWLALPEIMAYSSNIASAHMANAVGTQRHREFMVRMGMGSRLGIELTESALPLIPSQRNWREINTMTIGFGHGISVTPLHVANGIASLVNGGIYRQPTILAQDPGVERQGERVVSERTSDLMRRLMRIAVTQGSGKGADVPGYYVGGKTGTAQKAGPNGGYLHNKRIAAFVGAFPMHSPRYVIYVMVDEPKPNARSQGYATAGWVAAPAAGMVISRMAPILGLMPEAERPDIIRAVDIPLQPPRPAAPARPAATPGAPVQGGTGARPAATAPDGGRNTAGATPQAARPASSSGVTPVAASSPTNPR